MRALLIAALPLVGVQGLVLGPHRPCCAWRHPLVSMSSDPEAVPQLSEAELERRRKFDALFVEDSAVDEVDPEKPSHLSIERDEDGEPELLRFTYVDEHTCIGCTYCTQVARCTFMLEPDNGRARVFHQGGDSDDTIQEAIDSCPVSCIHYVSLEDLVTLEQERKGQVINNKARLVNQQEATAFAPPTAAGKGYTGMRCNNCPTKGCKTCPMFGVGENPVYLQKLREREDRKRARGDLQREEEDERRRSMIEGLTETERTSAKDGLPPGMVETAGTPNELTPQPGIEDKLSLLFDQASFYLDSMPPDDDPSVDSALDALNGGADPGVSSDVSTPDADASVDSASNALNGGGEPIV